MAVRVQAEPFDLPAEMSELRAGRTDLGAVVTFTGIVRDSAHGMRLRAMALEHFPGMAEAAIAHVEAEAHKRWPLTGSLVIHRYGRLLPGEDIVLVVTASAHRHAAFAAAEFLMDYLKTDAPFWKKEEFVDGSLIWVEADTKDDDARERWRRPGG
jgi:molybdopterin synthase catalytic subunit